MDGKSSLCKGRRRKKHLTVARPDLHVYELIAKRILEAAKCRVRFGRNVSIGSKADIRTGQRYFRRNRTLAEIVGTTRSRVSTFMNKFRELGFINYNGDLEVHNSLLNVILHDKPPD
jgi:hypothetical protein